MKPLFIHTLNDSFRMFFERTLLQNGEAFRNISGQLYRVNDLEFPNRYVYSNPYGQFNYDSSVSGSNIPSGVYINGNFTPRGTNGLIIDYNHGRVIFDNNPNGIVTANYSVKDFNIYSTSKSDEELLFENKITFRPKYTLPLTGIPSDKIYGPLIYLKRDVFTNDPFALGGMDNSVASYRAIILTNNEYDLDGVGSVFADAARKNFLILDKPPLNRYGDIYSGNSYNYLEDVNNNYDTSKLVCITDVDFYRFDSKTETKLNMDFYAGFLEFTLEIPRYPRV